MPNAIFWSEDEIKTLIEFYGKEDIKVLQTKLNNKTLSQIRQKAFQLGLSKTAHERWTQAEIDILYEYYGKEPIEQLVKRLPGRSAHNIRVKASSLGIKSGKRNAWTKEEIEILKTYYPVEGLEVVKRLPGRSEKDIYAKADRLGIIKKTSNVWTEEEIEILKKYYPIETAAELKKRLSRHSIQMINNKANKLGLHKLIRGKGLKKKWSIEEENILKQYYKIEGLEVVKRLPGRSIQDITAKAFRMGLCEERFFWTEEEDNYLKEHYENEDTNDIANVLTNHSKNAIISRAKQLGLKKKKKGRKKKVEQNEVNNENNVEPSSHIDEVDDSLKDESTIDDNEAIELTSEDLQLAEKIRNENRKNKRKKRKHRSTFKKIKNNKKEPINWTDDDIEIVKQFYPIEGTAVISRLSVEVDTKEIRALARKLKIITGRLTEPWSVEEDILACKFYLKHVDDWNKKEIIDELLDIFISNGFMKHKQKTLHMKLANCSYIHTGIGLEHASKQNIKIYDKLTGNNWFKRFIVRIRRFFKRIFK